MERGGASELRALSRTLPSLVPAARAHSTLGVRQGAGDGGADPPRAGRRQKAAVVLRKEGAAARGFVPRADDLYATLRSVGRRRVKPMARTASPPRHVSLAAPSAPSGGASGSIEQRPPWVVDQDRSRVDVSPIRGSLGRTAGLGQEAAVSTNVQHDDVRPIDWDADGAPSTSAFALPPLAHTGAAAAHALGGGRAPTAAAAAAPAAAVAAAAAAAAQTAMLTYAAAGALRTHAARVGVPSRGPPRGGGDRYGAAALARVIGEELVRGQGELGARRATAARSAVRQQLVVEAAISNGKKLIPFGAHARRRGLLQIFYDEIENIEFPCTPPILHACHILFFFAQDFCSSGTLPRMRHRTMG